MAPRAQLACRTGRTTISSCRNLRSSAWFEATRGRDTYITTEVGQHQMWAAQGSYGFRGAAPLDDVGRSRHHGLRPAGGAGACRVGAIPTAS